MKMVYVTDWPFCEAAFIINYYKCILGKPSGGQCEEYKPSGVSKRTAKTFARGMVSNGWPSAKNMCVLNAPDSLWPPSS